MHYEEPWTEVLAWLQTYFRTLFIKQNNILLFYHGCIPVENGLKQGYSSSSSHCIPTLL